jgi:hypothetical protein
VDVVPLSPDYVVAWISLVGSLQHLGHTYVETHVTWQSQSTGFSFRSSRDTLSTSRLRCVTRLSSHLIAMRFAENHNRFSQSWNKMTFEWFFFEKFILILRVKIIPWNFYRGLPGPRLHVGLSKCTVTFKKLISAQKGLGEQPEHVAGIEVQNWWWSKAAGSGVISFACSCICVSLLALN